MKKRILSILLLCCMVLTLLPTAAFAADTGKAIQLGTDALSKNVNTATAPTVYFGQDHENNPAAWRVIGYNGNGVTSAQGDMTLLAAGNMSSVLQFGDFETNNRYASSYLKTAIDALAEKLTTEENTAVKKRTLTSGSYNGENTDCVAGEPVDNAVFWPLSTAEAFAVNEDLRIVDKEHPDWASSFWWLRSPGASDHDAATVHGNGSVVYSGNAISSWWCVRPAFNLNSSSVLFTSAAVGGKPDGGLTPISKYTGNEWKLTLKDSNRNFAVTETTVSGDPGDTVTLHYTGATAGINEYISVILADNSGAQYYGRVAQPTAENGTVEIKIPSGLAPGSYTLKVFSEQCNGDKKTDYASDFVDIDLTVGYQEQFTLTPGGVYYFDLSGVSIPGTANGSLPDKTMHYVPFTYAGTVDAYKLTSEMATTEEYAQQNEYAHSLFVADYAVTHAVSWDDLNATGLIFGKGYATGSVDYTLRAPSGGSGGTGSGALERGTPQSNEWDRILDKDDGYIKNWRDIGSWGQDTLPNTLSNRVIRGRYDLPRKYAGANTTLSFKFLGFRPVLEVLNPDTLDPDGLKAVTLDLGGGKLGGSSDTIQIIVKTGESFTAPASEGLTRPDGNTGSYFEWLGSDGELYAPDDNVPADVTKLTAQFVPPEQFNLAPDGTYYFDLSGVSIPGTADDALPDKTMHYVPFTYAGTVDAYKLTSAMAATDEYAEKNKYAHSLFVADYTVTHTVSWDELNAGRLIFGRDYAAGGVDYILRAPSVGSGSIGSAESQRGTPPSNEWDRILDKNDGYIKNWFGMFSWGQDTLSTSESDRAARGYFPPGGWSSAPASHQNAVAGFRPILEVLSPGSLGSDGLKAVTLDLDGGKLGNSSEDIQIIVKSGESFAAPASDGLTRPDGNTDNYFKWLGSDGELYEPGDNVSADVTKLTAQFNLPEQFTLAPGGTYYFDLSGAGIPGTANDALPDATLHYVPFTYAGMVNAYKLTSAMETTEEYAEQNKYDHSLFVAEYNVTRAVSWIDLNTAGLIFGKDYTSDGVDYTLRAPSVGSASTGSYDLERGTPQSNEWDKILDKGNGYIKNWEGMESWGQDIMEDLDVSAHRGHMSARYWNCSTDTFSQLYHGFRPVLEVLGLDTLGADGLKAVTLDLGDGKLGVESSIQIIVIDDSTFTAPASDGLTRPDGNTGSYFMWLGSDGKLYDPGDNVPADVTKLTAQFASSSHSVTITTATLPDGKVGEAYSQTLIATGTTPITWSIIGALPDGLSLNKDTGKISGTPTAAGSSTFTVKATNSAGSDTKELSITITKDAPPAHEHRYGDWRKDGTNHWHECTDADCPNREESIKDKAAHVYTDDADTTCDTCGYERTITPPAHEHRYGDWRKDGTNHWHECTDADCPNREESIKDKAAHVYDNDADTTCNTCGYERTVTPPAHEHIVTFDGNGGTSSVGSMTTTNQKLTSLPSASRSGSYSFDGWYTEKSGGTKITTDTVFSANTTVYAHWTYTGGGGGYNPPVTYYTLRFETGGGSDIPSVREAYNTYIDLTKYVPTWRGHTFIGWYTERSLTNKVSGVYLTKDMTVYAGWRVDENPGTGANPFTDVSEKDWFYGDVMFVYENGLMLGTSKTLFSPHGTATRGMMATILWRMEGSPAPKGKNSFTDVEAGKWYADAITWTAESGIFAGYGKDKFGPDDPITREQLAAIFYRYADYKGYDLTVKGNLDKFKDADKITDYAKTAMQWAVGSGLVKGKSGNLLDPQGTATRAEIAAMLHRFIEKYELVQGKAPGGLMGWIDPKRLQIPKTGDSSVLGLWGFSLCTSLAGCLALTTWQIRRRREEESLQIIEK